MIVLISPAKSLNAEVTQAAVSRPAFVKEANALIKVLKTVSGQELKKMMSLSDKLVAENLQRYKSFRSRGADDHSLPAVHLFAGDVYRGLEAHDFNKKEENFAQAHLRILSGLYGVVRPMDGIQPYRLEMGTTLKTDKGNNLYQYWGDKVSKELNKSLLEVNSNLIVNLASNEYFKVVDNKKLKADVLNINFKEYRDGELKFISFSAKVARGLMARYIIKHQIEAQEELKGFDSEGYYFSEELSTENNWLFVR